ncbi:MAG TPA: hypothetical protein PKE63_07860 [Lacibacter sp.]|nr:hypothetical protein [Lacibacter sp.]HMO89569.1 hypothetical protein [Lacibacter sp.]HMP87180.1 hypothetical protein [Lacibacter sp.]
MKFLKRIWKAISRLWNKVDDFTEQNVEQALRVTSGLKRFLESPAADILEAIIPGNVDALVRKHLLQATNTAVTALGIVDACKGLNDREKLLCIINELQKLPKDGRDAVLFKLAALIAKYLDKNKLPQSSYDLLVQGKYFESKK